MCSIIVSFVARHAKRTEQRSRIPRRNGPKTYFCDLGNLIRKARLWLRKVLKVSFFKWQRQ